MIVFVELINDKLKIVCIVSLKISVTIPNLLIDLILAEQLGLCIIK